MKTRIQQIFSATACRWILALSTIVAAGPARAATFTNSASIKADDPTGALTSATGPFTVSCWFRISIPTSATLTENMTILMDRTDGNESANYAYLLRFNVYSGNVEFVTRGNSGVYTNILIQRPYLERWYHVAVVRSGSTVWPFVDGRPLPSDAALVGTSMGSGLTIGGISGTSRPFYGDIIEVAFYNSSLSASLIQDRMFKDQRSFPNLKGYYKLAHSTNDSDLYRNFVPTPPTSTDPAIKLGSGKIGFEETDAGGEQSIFDSRKNHGQDALAPLSGAFAWSQTAFARPVPGIAFDFRYGYSSVTPTAVPADGSSDPYDRRVLGPGWRHAFDARIAPEQSFSERRLITWDGSIETWVKTNNIFKTRHQEYRGELALNADTGKYEWTTPERLVYRFRDPTDGTVMAGRLEQIRDFNGNVVTLQWNEDEALLTNVVDTVGTTYAFRYNLALGLLTNVSFGSWQVNFTFDTNRLVSKSIANTSGLYASANTAWQFFYSANNGLLERILDPRGNTNILVQYDQYGRKTNAVDALGRATHTEYNVPANRQIRSTDADGFKWLETYDRKGRILAQQDPLTNVMRNTYDVRGNRISITEPLGWATLFGYDDRANVIARTNALGEVTRWAFHPFFNKPIQQITPQPSDANGWTTWTNFYTYDAGGNLTDHSDALGSLVHYTYSANGLVLNSTDANGNVSRFAYDTNGFLTARTDPATNTTTFVVNDVGLKLRESNPLGDSTTYALDMNGNPVRIQDVLSRVFNRTYDANGNLLSSTDGKLQMTAHAYDAANQRTNTTDRTGTNNWLTFYTVRGKVDRVTDPLRNSATNTYDAANRLVRVTDPLGQSVTNQYDANGNLIVLFDKLGQRWSKTYDRLNRVLAETDPLGNTRSTAYDAAGRILQTTTPNGYPTLHAYDGRGRLTKWHDAEGFDWIYDYDGIANITNITDALGGHYIMAYGPRNERTLEQNQDTNRWEYAYDELLRLQRQTDPNGTTRTPTYDPAGRVLLVDFSTGRQDSFAYDDNDNPKLIKRRVSGVTTATQFIYDRLDRPIEQTDALAQTVQYGYDPLGRVTALTYPGGKTLTHRYDPLGRLTSQVDWAERQMTYAYDRADRLISRAYPNGVIQTNSFDNASRLTALKYQISNPQSNSIAIALAYAYDRNGNKTGSNEKGTLPWPQPSLTDETARYTPAGRLIDRTINPLAPTGGEGQGEGAIRYAYDASGNMTNAAGNGQSWSLTYDEDNRTTSIHWDAGLTAKHVVNRYDALGRRISKTVDGTTTGYVLSLVGGMERILCDLDSGGAVVAWYVHGPDLCYRVDSANNLVCYHADAMANIICLTGTNGTNLAQYAYTPYGRSLASSNLQSQISNPYLFVGSQGVMEELPGLYFMRARYYSADAGVFLSTDPVKKVGPGWKPVLYAYASETPICKLDPKGETPAHVTAFMAGMVSGMIEGVFEAAIEETLTRLPAAMGASESEAENIMGAAFDILSAANTGIKTYKYAKTVVAAGDPSSLVAANTLGEVAGGKVGNSIYSLSGKLMIGYMAAVNITGSAIGGVLYNNFGVGVLPPAKLSTPTANSSLASQTASVVAPKGSGATAATSTKPAGGTAGGGTTSSGGGGTTYTVKAGDTLGNIGYANGTTATAIGAANGIQNLNRIYPGQVLTIPRR